MYKVILSSGVILETKFKDVYLQFINNGAKDFVEKPKNTPKKKSTKKKEN